MAPVIRISDENLSRLKMWAEPLEDSADDALGKALTAAESHRDGPIMDHEMCPDQSPDDVHKDYSPDFIGSGKQDVVHVDDAENSDAVIRMDVPNTKINRIQKREAVPREAYAIPILESLYELDGRALGRDVLKAVELKTKHLFSDVDYEVVNGNIPRWRKGAQWTRQTLKNKGLLKRDSTRGIWELTEQGIAEVEGQRLTSEVKTMCKNQEDSGETRRGSPALGA